MSTRFFASSGLNCSLQERHFTHQRGIEVFSEVITHSLKNNFTYSPSVLSVARISCPQTRQHERLRVSGPHKTYKMLKVFAESFALDSIRLTGRSIVRDVGATSLINTGRRGFERLTGSLGTSSKIGFIFVRFHQYFNTSFLPIER